MPLLSVGEKLGPYEILEPLGVGGMGEVWKARDTRLNRHVAIKKSQARFSERFALEAQAIAALNRPHICQIYDVGSDYLVMEYVEGKPLTGPLPVAEALQYASQITDALMPRIVKGACACFPLLYNAPNLIRKITIGLHSSRLIGVHSSRLGYIQDVQNSAYSMKAGADPKICLRCESVGRRPKKMHLPRA